EEAAEVKGTLFKDLPLLTTTQTVDQLKNKPINTVLARRSSDPTTSDQLVIAVKAGDGPPPMHGIMQHKLLPGKEPDTFILTGVGEFTIDQLKDHFSGTATLTAAAASIPKGPSAA